MVKIRNLLTTKGFTDQRIKEMRDTDIAELIILLIEKIEEIEKKIELVSK